MALDVLRTSGLGRTGYFRRHSRTVQHKNVPEGTVIKMSGGQIETGLGAKWKKVGNVRIAAARPHLPNDCYRRGQAFSQVAETVPAEPKADRSHQTGPPERGGAISEPCRVSFFGLERKLSPGS